MAGYTVNKLAEIVGMQRATVKRRLETVEPIQVDGQSKIYDSKVALAAIFESTDNPQKQKARLDGLRADKVELDLQLQKQEVVSLDDIVSDLERAGVEIKNKMLGIPTKAAPLIIGQTKLPRIKEILEDLIHEALESIGDSGRGILAGINAPATADGEPVG